MRSQSQVSRPADERTVSHSELADFLGCRHSYVTKLKQAGRLVMTDDGKRIRLEASLARIEATKDPARNDSMQSTPSENTAQNAPESAADETDGADLAAGWGYQESRARKERYLAEMARLEYEREAGKLLPLDDVVASCASAATQIRTRLESLPAILAPRLASETDEQAIAAVLTEEIEHMLGELSRQLAQIRG